MLEKLLKKIKQNYFSAKNSYLLSTVKFEDIIETINNNAKNEILEASNQTLSNDNIIRIYKEDDLYAIYLNSVRVIMKDSNDVRVSILGDSQSWKITTDDITSSDTISYNVYVFYQTTFPTGNVLYDEVYISGTWNEFVYNQISEIFNHILSFKEKNIFNKLYQTPPKITPVTEEIVKELEAVDGVFRVRVVK